MIYALLFSSGFGAILPGAGSTGVSFDAVRKSGGWGDITKVEMDPFLLLLLLLEKNSGC